MWRIIARSPRVPDQVLDAVVCDPPYGVRAGGRKSHAKPGLQVRDRAAHITSTAPYSLGARPLQPHAHHCHCASALLSGDSLRQRPARSCRLSGNPICVTCLLLISHTKYSKSQVVGS